MDGKAYTKRIDGKTETANAKQLYSAAKESQTNTAPILSPEQSRRLLVMTTLWQRMREMFGNVWVLNYGDVGSGSMQTWTAGLAEYSENQIRMGVEQCRNWANPFPPNLGQFAKLCLTRAPAPTPEPSKVKSLSDLTKSSRADSPIAKREKERMRRIMAGDQDVESKERSLELLGLHARWGA